MMAIKLLLCAVLLCLASQTLATQKCNIHNFSMQGAYKCGLEWWQARDLGQTIKFKYKVSDIVEKSLTKMGMSVAEINQALEKSIMATSTDPLGKIIESALMVEPYLTYIISDLILGMDITAEDLKKFGLPEQLASRDEIIQLFSDYMTGSCSDKGVGPFVSCMERWMTENCVAEDKPQVITGLLNTMRDTYCTGTNVKHSVIENLLSDLGTVFKSIPAFLGVYRDPASPYLFNIRTDSIMMDQTLSVRFLTALTQDCAYLLQIVPTQSVLLSAANSTAGAGEVIESMLRSQDSASMCIFRVIHKVIPNAFSANEKAIEHMEPMMKRYALSEITFKETNVATEERHTVMVYGDPHMIPYKATKAVTCPAIGQQPYLANEFFTLYGKAAPFPEGDQLRATYVQMVVLIFAKREVPTMYYSGGGPVANYLLINNTVSSGTDSIQISKVGEVVQITDMASGAVFGFSKYGQTYYFTVRAGEKVLDGSLGLLTTGCPDPVSMKKVRRRRSTECETACADVEVIYQDTCNFDCVEMKDTKVAQISKGVVSLKKQVEAEDAKVLKDLGVTPRPATTPQSATRPATTRQSATTPPASTDPKYVIASQPTTKSQPGVTRGQPKNPNDGGDACQHLPSLMLVLSLAFFVRYF